LRPCSEVGQQSEVLLIRQKSVYTVGQVDLHLQNARNKRDHNRPKDPRSRKLERDVPALGTGGQSQTRGCVDLRLRDVVPVDLAIRVPIWKGAEVITYQEGWQ
jgi:hypothetical protein